MTTGNQAARVFDRLQAIERIGGLGVGSSIRKFIALGDWYFTRRFVARIFLQSWSDDCLIAALKPSKRRITKRLLGADCEIAYTSAEVVNVRAHWRRTGLIRCFYPGKRPLSVKASLDSDEGRAIIEHELEVRTVIDAIGQLRTAMIVGSHVADGLAQMHEAWVGGRMPNRSQDIDRVVQELVPALESHYRGYGARFEPLSNVIGEGLADAVREVVDRVDWQPQSGDAGSFIRTIERLEHETRTLPVSLCHADLNLGHVVLQRSHPPLLIDWNAARETAIAIDAAELILSCPIARDRLLNAGIGLLKKFSQHDTYSPIDQLFLITLRKVHGWREMQRRFEAENRPGHFATAMKRVLSDADYFLNCRRSTQRDV